MISTSCGMRAGIAMTTTEFVRVSATTLICSCLVAIPRATAPGPRGEIGRAMTVWTRSLTIFSTSGARAFRSGTTFISTSGLLTSIRRMISSNRRML